MAGQPSDQSVSHGEADVSLRLGAEAREGQHRQPEARGLSTREHGRLEAIAAPGNGLDVRTAAGLGVERLAQRGDRHAQVAFLDRCVRPDPAHQLLLRHHVAAVLDEGTQEVESLGRESHELAAPPQHGLRGIEAKGAELEDGALGQIVTFRKTLRKVQARAPGHGAKECLSSLTW